MCPSGCIIVRERLSSLIFNSLCGNHECFVLTSAAIMPDKPVPYAFYPLLPDSDEEEEALAMIPWDKFRRRLRIRADPTDETRERGAGDAAGHLVTGCKPQGAIIKFLR